MKKHVKVVRDPSAVKLAIEDTRSNILSLLRVKDMTISQLTESLDKDQSTIYRHIKKLEESGFIESVGSKKEHHIPEKLYGRTASLFLLAPSSIDTGQPSEIMIEWERKHSERIIELLSVMGYNTDETENIKENLSEILLEFERRVVNPIEESEEEIGKISFPLLLKLELVLFLFEIRDDEKLKDKIDEVLSTFTKSE
ncbi:MAG: ArsR/SmtB family transcription factor [Thermoplasmatota archaeon]